MGKIRKTFLIMIGIMLVWSHLPYHYNNEKVAAYATIHAAGGSRCMCAWYVVKAMWRGGCPIGLIPAYAYDKTLPQMGFNEISTEGYRPMTGDISVLPQNEKSQFGHIAVWNGKQWVSDFRQKSIYPGSAYRKNGGFKVFRAKTGWHWKHVWTSPVDWYSWIKSFVRGYDKIKF